MVDAPESRAPQPAELDAAELDAAELDAAELDAAEPEAAELDGADLDAAEPEAAELDGADLDAGDARVVLVTAPDLAVARGLGRRLVEERLAACVNLVPGLTSVYRWQGRVEEEAEVLLILKTTGRRLAEVEAFLGQEHPSEVPECVALRPSEVEGRYLAWLLASCAPATPGAAGGS